MIILKSKCSFSTVVPIIILTRNIINLDITEGITNIKKTNRKGFY